jgi:hypothetical protein
MMMVSDLPVSEMVAQLVLKTPKSALRSTRSTFVTHLRKAQ